MDLMDPAADKAKPALDDARSGDRRAQDQRAGDNDDDVVAEPGECFLRRHRTRGQRGQQREDRHEIIAKPPPDEQDHRSRKNPESEHLGSGHGSNRFPLEWGAKICHRPFRLTKDLTAKKAKPFHTQNPGRNEKRPGLRRTVFARGLLGYWASESPGGLRLHRSMGEGGESGGALLHRFVYREGCG